MNLDTYLESVRGGIANATALADDQSRDIAQRLGDAVESSVRLSLIEALSDATAEISAHLAPSSVDFHLAGGEPRFVVTAAPASAGEDDYDDTFAAGQPGNDTPGGDDEEQVRVTLRLPASIKTQVDDQANAEGVSTNTWLLQRVLESLGRRSRRGRGERDRGPWSPGAEGWPGFAFGPDFPFSPGGPFGDGGRGPRREAERHRERGHHDRAERRDRRSGDGERDGRRGRRGWVR